MTEQQTVDTSFLQGNDQEFEQLMKEMNSFSDSVISNKKNETIKDFNDALDQIVFDERCEASLKRVDDMFNDIMKDTDPIIIQQKQQAYQNYYIKLKIKQDQIARDQQIEEQKELNDKLLKIPPKLNYYIQQQQKLGYYVMQDNQTPLLYQQYQFSQGQFNDQNSQGYTQYYPQGNPQMMIQTNQQLVTGSVYQQGYNQVKINNQNDNLQYIQQYQNFIPQNQQYEAYQVQIGMPIVHNQDYQKENAKY